MVMNPKPLPNILYHLSPKKRTHSTPKSSVFVVTEFKNTSTFLGHRRMTSQITSLITEMVDGLSYIYLTDSSGCASRRFKSWADQVPLIDYKKLRHMGIAVATAPDLAKAFKVSIYYDNISERGLSCGILDTSQLCHCNI